MSDEEQTSVVQTEAMVLRGMLEYPEAIPMLDSEGVKHETFETEKSRWFFRVFRDLFYEARDFSAVSCLQKLTELGGADRFKDESEIFLLFETIQSYEPSLNSARAIQDAAGLLKKRHLARLFRERCSTSLNKSGRIEVDPDTEISTLIADLQSLQAGNARFTGVSNLREAAIEWTYSHEERLANGGKIPGLRTGWKQIDDMIGGLRAARLYMIAAFYKAGKSASALQIGLEAALPQNTPTVIFLLEMPAEMQVHRWLAQAFGLDQRQLTHDNVRIGEWDWPTFRDILRSQDLPSEYFLDRLDNLIIVDNPDMSVAQGEAFLHQMNHKLRAEGKPPIGLVIWDYLQIITPDPGRRYGSRQEEVDRIGGDLAKQAKRFNVPVLALSQVADAQQGGSRESRNLQGHAAFYWEIKREMEPLPESRRLYRAEWHLKYQREATSGVKLRMLWDEARQQFREVDERIAASDPGPTDEHGYSQIEIPDLGAEDA